MTNTERITSILPRPRARSRGHFYHSPLHASLLTPLPTLAHQSTEHERRWSGTIRPRKKTKRQAVRSLGPLRCTCYQASTCGLSTRSSSWDLDCLLQDSGKTHLGGGFALRCIQRLSLLDVAIQLWPRQANWHTSGRAISVLSYWR